MMKKRQKYKKSQGKDVRLPTRSDWRLFSEKRDTDAPKQQQRSAMMTDVLKKKTKQQ